MSMGRIRFLQAILDQLNRQDALAGEGEVQVLRKENEDLRATHEIFLEQHNELVFANRDLVDDNNKLKAEAEQQIRGSIRFWQKSNENIIAQLYKLEQDNAASREENEKLKGAVDRLTKAVTSATFKNLGLQVKNDELKNHVRHKNDELARNEDVSKARLNSVKEQLRDIVIKLDQPHINEGMG